MTPEEFRQVTLETIDNLLTHPILTGTSNLPVLRAQRAFWVKADVTILQQAMVYYDPYSGKN